LDNLEKTDNWNSLFLNPNSIMEIMASRLGLTKREMLDKEIENPA